MRYATLNVLAGPLKGQSLPLKQRETTIGRTADCGLALESYEKVSRRHATLLWDGKAFVIEDLGSTNGVAVDGQAVTRCSLRAGSRLKLGDFSAELWLPPGQPQFDGEPQRLGGVGAAWRLIPGSNLVKGAIAGGVAVVLAIAAVYGLKPNEPRQVRFRLPSAASAASGSSYTVAASTAPSSAPINGRISPAAIKNAKAATVLIAHPTSNGYAFGSGFVTGKGLQVVTNRHVVVDGGGAPVDCVLVFNCGTSEEFRIDMAAAAIQLAPQANDGQDFTDDLAVLALDAPVVPGLPLGRAEELTEADTVYAIGFPLGVQTLTLNGQLPTVSVKALSVERLQSGKVQGSDATTLLQLGGTVTHGNSGGPVVNLKGEVVGVTSRAAEGTGMSYAIPSVFVKGLLLPAA